MSTIKVNELQTLAGTNSVNVADIAKTSSFSGVTGASLVGYMPSGTNAVMSTVQNRLRQVISILDFVNNDALGLSPADSGSGRPINTVDWTSSIQAAVNYANLLGTSPFVGDGSPCSVFFPAGRYNCWGTVTLTGAVCIEGDGAPASFTGSSIWVQGTAHALFTVASTVPCAVYFDRIALRGNGATPTDSGSFQTTGTGSSGNSYYFRDCWFSAYGDYALNISTTTDDLQIVNCTFDVSEDRFIKLGKAGYPVINSVISGCTFYTGAEVHQSLTSCIEIVACKNLLITNNRFLTHNNGYCKWAITGTSAQAINVVVSGNTCQGSDIFCNVSGDNWIVTNNIVTSAKSPITVGASVNHLTITDNYLEGNAGIYGVIDCASALDFSSIKNNNINGLSTSAFGLNLGSTYYLGHNNQIQDNIVRGCTVNGMNGIFTFTPTLVGLTTPGTFTYSINTGKYYVHSDRIVLDFVITLSGITSTPTGEVVISGLPTPNSAMSVCGSAVVYNITYPAGTTNYVLSYAGSASVIRLLFSGTGNTLLGLAPSNLTTTTTIVGSISYIA